MRVCVCEMSILKIIFLIYLMQTCIQLMSEQCILIRLWRQCPYNLKVLALIQDYSTVHYAWHIVIVSEYFQRVSEFLGEY